MNNNNIINDMNNIKEDINYQKKILESINLQKKEIEQYIIQLNIQLCRICPHTHKEIIFNYYDKTTKKCCNCDYEE